jgi:hypothetical protein
MSGLRLGRIDGKVLLLIRFNGLRLQNAQRMAPFVNSFGEASFLFHLAVEAR